MCRLIGVVLKTNSVAGNLHNVALVSLGALVGVLSFLNYGTTLSAAFSSFKQDLSFDYSSLLDTRTRGHSTI